MGYKKTQNARPIVNITIPDELLEKIEDFRYEERCKNRSNAICILVEMGLKAYKEQKEKNG